MKGVLAGVVCGMALIVGVALASGAVNVTYPWEVLPEFTAVEIELELPAEARIVEVERIALDCRARVHAEVPVEGRREHRVLGQVYRTDSVSLHAIGDVDTCVEGTSAEVVYRRDGTMEVVIPGESIVFVRPRVDTVATAESVTVVKGQLGKLTDVFPWVDDDLGLTPLAYAYAQNVIGSSECMEAAFTVTEDILIDAYRQQFVDQGADPDSLTVRIEGRPLFPDPPAMSLGDAVTMAAGTDGVQCLTADGLGRPVPRR